jgi:DNA-binding NarL/FixJ family response regulator
MTNQEIAAAMGLATNTVRNHLREIFDRAGVWNRPELARFVLSEAADGETETG